MALFLALAAPAGVPRAESQPPRGPRLVVDRAVADMGEVVRGRVGRVEFALRNAGSETLLVESAKPG